MLSIITKQGKEIDWHIGELLPLWLHRDSIDHIVADGDELDHIVDLFTVGQSQVTIPLANKRVVIWTGEFAKMIFVNLSK